MLIGLKYGAVLAMLTAAIGMSATPAGARAAVAKSYYVVVKSNGVKARGTTGTNSKHLKTGLYQVHFAVKVSTCAYVGTVGVDSPQNKPVSGFGGNVAQITPVLGTPTDVFVVTSKSGKPTDLGFYLIAGC